MKHIEPQDMAGFRWVMRRIDDGEIVSVYTDGRRLFHGGQRIPPDACHVGTYSREWKRLKFDLFRFIADIAAARDELEAQSAVLGMGR